MKRVALKIAYIGTNFHGFQRQPNLRTVEGEIIRSLDKLDLFDDFEKSRFSIAGRTDRGVHSLGNVISFQSEKEIIINQINHSLPDDIQILAKAPVRFGFKPRYALQRWYRYILFEKNLNIKAIEELTNIFKGEHDFTNFSKRNQKTPVRTIDDIKIILPDIKDEHNIKSTPICNSYKPIFIDIYGESFLWNMVRKMMKIFVEVGKNSLDLSEVKKLFNPSKKTNIAPLSPENLILMDVKYNKINFKYDEYACERFRRIIMENLVNYRMNYMIENKILDSMNDIYK